MTRVPYRALAWFYFFYFAHLGTYGPYFSLYLDNAGMSAERIGIVMSLPLLVRIVATHGWGWLADHLACRMPIVRVGLIAGLACFCAIVLDKGFAWIATVIVVSSLFMSAVLPMVEVTTLGHVAGDSGRYGRIRLWGSVGFIAAVTGVGAALDAIPVHWVIWFMLGALGASALSTWAIPDPPIERHASDTQSIAQVFLRPEVLALIGACALMSVAHGPYYAFFSIHLVGYGYSKTAIGWFWAIGVLVEVGVFWWMPRLFATWPVRTVLIGSFALAALRFALIAWTAQWIATLLVAQLLHAASFASFHAAALAVLHRFFRGRHEARGQAIYSSLTFGVGGALGALYSGYSWSGLGPAATYAIAAACAAAGAALLAWKLRVPAAS
jgi:PPP family 3-phenylpropionic acid transporter